MEVTDRHVLAISETSQAGEARRLAQAIAERVGLDATEAGRVALVVTEAATNLVKHARGGELLIAALADDGSRGVGVLALDRGPGIPNVTQSLGDGFSTAGSAGTGLGAIRRCSTVFDIYSSPAGTAILARIWSAPRTRPATPRLDVGAISVPIAGETVCGDDWAVVERPSWTALVVDGLGHGAGAAAAADAAVATFRRYGSGTPTEILERIHTSLRGTRGAAAAVAELDRERRLVRFAGIGNIAGTILVDGTSRSMVSHHGVLGHEVRKIHEFTYPWPEGALVVLNSDGLTSRWDVCRYPGLARRHPTLTAGVLYRDFRRGRDDATVVVVRETP